MSGKAGIGCETIALGSDGAGALEGLISRVIVTLGEVGTKENGSGRLLWMLRNRWSGLVELIRSAGAMPRGLFGRAGAPVAALGDCPGLASGDAAGAACSGAAGVSCETASPPSLPLHPPRNKTRPIEAAINETWRIPPSPKKRSVLNDRSNKIRCLALSVDKL
jgi:hypothetical protein